jgi:hypothetical protein
MTRLTNLQTKHLRCRRPDASRMMTDTAVPHTVFRGAGKLIQPAMNLLEWSSE